MRLASEKSPEVGKTVKELVQGVMVSSVILKRVTTLCYLVGRGGGIRGMGWKGSSID